MSLQVTLRRQLASFELAVDFSAARGVTALFGRSGSGKSCTVEQIAGLLRPDSGRITLDNRVLFDAERRIALPPHRRRIGYVFQDSRLFPHLSVANNLRFGECLTPRRERRVKAGDVIELLALGPLLQRRPRALSGGERQRVAIGRALLCSPALLLMDEPLSALDMRRKRDVLPFLERLRDELAMPMVYVSHAIEEIARLADRVVLLEDGQQLAIDTPARLLTRLDLREHTGRFEASSVVPARVIEHHPAYAVSLLESAGGVLITPQLQHPPGTALRLRLRARDLSIARSPVSQSSERSQLRGIIEDIVEESGTFAEVVLRLPDDTPVLIRVARINLMTLQLGIGDSAYAVLKTAALDRASVL